MHLLISILGFLSLYFIYRVLRRHSSFALAILAVLMLLFNRSFFYHSVGFILSDVPYLFFSMLTIFLFSKYTERKESLSPLAISLLAFLILSYLSRYLGIALLLGLLMNLLLRKDYKKLIFLGSLSILGFLLWIAYILAHPSQDFFHLKSFFLIDNYAPYRGTLFQHPKYLFSRFLDGVNYYAEIITLSIFRGWLGRWHFLFSLLAPISMLLVWGGFWKSFREEKEVPFHYYFVVYFLLISLANPRIFGEGPRYLLPILPFVFFYFLQGLKFLFKPYLFYFLFLSIFVFNLFSFKPEKISFDKLPPSVRNFISLHQWVNENLPSQGLIISRKPTVTYFYTGHKSLAYPFSPNPDEIWKMILDSRARYILADEFSPQTFYYLVPFIYKYRKKIRLLHRIGETAIFEVLPP